MGYVSLKCNNCGADLEMDKNNLMPMCPYCGKKMLYDAATVSKLMKTAIIETERTKRHVSSDYTKRQESTEYTKRVKAHEKTERAKSRHEFWDSCMIYIVIIILVLFMFFLYLS